MIYQLLLSYSIIIGIGTIYCCSWLIDSTNMVGRLDNKVHILLIFSIPYKITTNSFGKFSFNCCRRSDKITPNKIKQVLFMSTVQKLFQRQISRSSVLGYIPLTSKFHAKHSSKSILLTRFLTISVSVQFFFKPLHSTQEYQEQRSVLQFHTLEDNWQMDLYGIEVHNFHHKTHLKIKSTTLIFFKFFFFFFFSKH